MSAIVITGDVVEGLRFEGPFADLDEAIEYASERYGDGESTDYTVAELSPAQNGPQITANEYGGVEWRRNDTNVTVTAIVDDEGVTHVGVETFIADVEIKVMLNEDTLFYGNA